MIVIYAKTAKKGLSYDKKGYSVLEGDDLPVVGEKYVLALFVQEDGSLLASGAGSTKEVNYSFFNKRKEKKKYQKLCNESDDSNRKRYNVNFKKIEKE